MIAGRIFVFHLNQRVSWKVILVSSRYAKRRSLLKIRPAGQDTTLIHRWRNPRIEIHALLSGGVKIQTDADFQRMQYQRGGSENYILAHTQYGHMRLCVFTGSVFQANA